MATLLLSNPPEIEGAKYPDFERWLQRNQYDRICCYCVLSNKVLEIEHYIPKSFDSSREHDPLNLLLACATCNRGKWDYHPDHEARRKQSKATHGFMALDPRSDDYASLIRVQVDDGVLVPLDGVEKERAAWHIGLTLLDLPKRNTDRKNLLRLHRAAEKIVAKNEVDPEVVEVLLNDFARSILFYELWGVPVSDTLRADALGRRRELLAKEQP